MTVCDIDNVYYFMKKFLSNGKAMIVHFTDVFKNLLRYWPILPGVQPSISLAQ